MSDIPPQAYIAAGAAFREQMGKVRDIGDAVAVALEAAAPAIRDQATAAERARIRQLAIRNQATCTSDEGTGCYFADLLDADL
jgi:hypothetical protein